MRASPSRSLKWPPQRPFHGFGRLLAQAASLLACLGTWQAAPAALAAPISHIRVLQTDANGRPNGPVFYETLQLPASTVPLYVAQGPAPALDAPLINAGSTQEARIRLNLGAGLHTFTLLGNQGTRNMTHAALTLAFGEDPQTVRIGAFAAFWTDQASAPAFAASPLLGGSLVYDDGLLHIELTEFFFASGSRYPGLDRVNDFGAGAVGARDAIGQFTLRVTDRLQPQPVPSPGTLPLLLAATVAAGLFWRRPTASPRS
jgi:hypothetical protein